MTSARRRSSFATSADWMRSRSATFLLWVEFGLAPRLSLVPRSETVSLPTCSETPLLVSDDLPPRNSVVSQQSTIVWASSP